MLKRVISLPIHFIASTAGAMIRLVNVNRVTFAKTGDHEFVLKERHWLSPLLIVPGNPVLRWRRTPVRVLSTQQWKRWERTIAPLDQVCDVASSRALPIAKIAGTSLAQILSNCDISCEQKIAVVALAASALHQFHQRECDTPEHGRVILSHGDASVRNVMISPESKTATWFDFDLRHDLNFPPVDRHADDLRALLFSAAHYFPLKHIAELVGVTHRHYPQRDVWHELSQQVNSRWFCVDLFHFAHTRPLMPAGKKLTSNGSPHSRTVALSEAIRKVRLSNDI